MIEYEHTVKGVREDEKMGQIVEEQKQTGNKFWFLQGLKDGVPIGMGYFAVAFTMGITAKNIGMTPVQATAWLKENMIPYYPVKQFKCPEEVK